MQKKAGLIKHLGVSNVTAEQIAEAQSIAPVVCVQNFSNIANRRDHALIDSLAEQEIGYVPFFPLGGFTPLQSETLTNVAARLNARPMTSHWRGCFNVRQTFCSFREHHQWNT